MNEITIEIPKNFEKYVDSAIVRASYLFPDVQICKSGELVSVQSTVASTQKIDWSKLRQDFLHILYRERIYTETLEIRKTIYGAHNE